MNRKIFKIISISFSVLIIVVLVVTLFITTSPGEQYIKEWLQSKLSDELKLSVKISQFETNLVSRVVIDTLDISTINDSPLLYVEHIHVDYSIFDLIGGDIAIKNLQIDSVAIAISFDSLQNYGIPLLDNQDTTSDTSTEESANIQFDNLSINQLSFSYLDTHNLLSIVLNGAVISVLRDKNDRYASILNVAEIVVISDSLDVQISKIQVEASIDSSKVQIVRANADIEGLTLKSKGEVALSGDQAIDFKADLNGSLNPFLAKLAEIYNLLPIETSELSVIVSVSGNIDNPELIIDGYLDKITIPDLSIDSTRFFAEYKNDQLYLDTLNLSILDGNLHGYGGVSLDSSVESSFFLKLNSIPISNLWQAVYNENSPYKGLLYGSVVMNGYAAEWRSWSLDANISGKQLQYEKNAIPDLLCNAKLDSGKSSWSIVHGTDILRGNLSIKNDVLKGTYAISIPDVNALARFADQIELAGSIWAEGEIEGTISNPSLTSKVHGANITYSNFPIDTIFSEFIYSDSNLIIRNLICEGMADSIGSERLLFGLDSLYGSLEYRCQLSGSLDNPTGMIWVKSIKPQFSLYYADSIEISISLKDQKLNLDNLIINHEHFKATLSAEYLMSSHTGLFDIKLSPSVDLSPNTESDLDSINIITDFGSINGEFGFDVDSNLTANVLGDNIWLGLLPLLEIDSTISEGVFAFALSLEGPYKIPDATLDIKVDSLLVSGFKIDSVLSDISLDKKLLTINSFKTFAQGQNLKASGQLGLELSEDGTLNIPEDAIITGAVEVDQFDIEVLQNMILPEGILRGVVSSSLQLSGTTTSPHFDGWLRALKGKFQQDAHSTPIDSISVSLTFIDSLIKIDSIMGNVSNIPVEASGSIVSSDYKSAVLNFLVDVGEFGRLGIVGSVSEENINLQVSADTLHLVVFEPMIPTIDSLGGILAGKMTISGPIKGPEIDGNMIVDSLSFQSIPQKLNLSQGNALIRFNKNRIELDSVTALINGGSLAISGAIEHDKGELTDISFLLHGQKINLKEPESYDILIDSVVLNYAKQKETYVLDGDLELGETRLTKGLSATAVLPWVQGIETVEMELPELVARTRLNIRIRESNQLWVDNNLAHIRLRSELGIIGTPIRPNFTGLIKIEEGYLLYLDRRFQVQEGSVYFNDPVKFNPDIKLDANTKVNVYRRTASEPYIIYIKAEGQLEQLQYGLFSEPSLEKSDIIALLTIGATRTELTSTNEDGEKTGLTQILKDRAAMLTSNRVSNYISRRAGSLFGFDEFTIQGNLFKFDDSWGPQLVASKSLSQKLKLTYSTTVGHLNDQTMRLGYYLTPRLSLQSETDRQGNSGLDLKYGIKFK